MYLWIFEVARGYGIYSQIIIADTEEEARSFLQSSNNINWFVAFKCELTKGYKHSIIE